MAAAPQALVGATSAKAKSSPFRHLIVVSAESRSTEEPIFALIADESGLVIGCSGPGQLLRTPVQTALHRLKYRRDIGLGDALAAQFSGFVANLNWPIDLVVPVPLGQKRLHERGYNQVGLMARPLSLSMNIAYAPEALTRERETRSQVGLTKTERHINVRGAFHCQRRHA